MFDIGAGELGVIFVASLLVLGPKRLPGLVKKVGRWVGKARSMARDFQQQLENEVNLEELNKMTEKVTREAQSILPSSADFTGEPPAPAASEIPTYPYSAHDTSIAEGSQEISTADAGAAPESPPTDDNYSHAHAAGDAPMPDVVEYAATDTASHADVPVQADLDLSSPEDLTHLPPDDARRFS